MSEQQKNVNVQPVILCGGSGTRLWPLSRTGFPKQFLCLTGDQSLFQLSVRRLGNLGSEGVHVSRPLIVAGEDHRFLVLEQLREMGIHPNAVLLEPVGRNTAPALTLAALAALESGDDPILVVTPSDQTVTDDLAFTTAMQTAIHEAATGSIVILGIPPDRPETGYGYIQTESQNTVCEVLRFVEKPDQATAQSYLDAGGFFWNAGIFILKASTWLAALKHFRPDIANATQTSWTHGQADVSLDQKFVRPCKERFAIVPSESIDYAVMEHCPNSHFDIKMVLLDAGWSDVGAWDAVWQISPKDVSGNVHIGDVLANDTQDTLVHARSRLVSLVGVKNLIVIETPDAVLIADKSHSQNVKHIVTALSKEKREESDLHRKVHRPWGWYDSIDEGHRFKVKRIQVNPKASLSLQKHHHRAEHWIVVKGTAEITCGDKTVLLGENQSTYIPLGETHRLRNPGSIPLEIIEVQSGSYLGEDDIVRLEDKYGR
jgi:mannose-1-phosphate guanylyltransferase/mannose-6-phosphate isomerase